MNNCESQLCSQLTSLTDAIDTIKIPGSGTLNVGNMITSNVNIVYGSDSLQVLNPLGPIVYGDIVIDLGIPIYENLEIYSSINYINGSLTIVGVSTSNEQILDLFPCLIGINGDLTMDVFNGNKMTGFYKLKYVTGRLNINANTLTTIPCFSELETIGWSESYNVPLPNPIPTGSSNFGNNSLSIFTSNLKQIIGFEKLKYVSAIIIDNNSSLQKICGFQSLILVDSIDINSNSNLTLIKGFNRLKMITDYLSISENTGTQNLYIDAFESLISIGDINIVNNVSLKSFCFKSLRNSYYIIIGGNNILESFEFPQLNNCSYLIITLNELLSNFNVCNLSNISNYLHIVQNNSLKVLNNFENLKTVGVGIAIIANNYLEKISDFKKLKIIGSIGQIPFTYYSDDSQATINTSWFNLSTLQTVLPNYNIIDTQNLDLPSSIFIYQNPLLKQLSGFNALNSIPHSVYILLNSSLEIINAFNKVTFALDLDIIGNPLLKTIKIFEELTYIRYLILSNTMCADKICGLTKLCQADVIYIDIQNPTKLPNLLKPLPTVEGVYNYYSFGNCCDQINQCKPSNCQNNNFQCKCINPSPLTNANLATHF
jgi:hypothetical protein